MDESLLWRARAFVYQRFADTALPPDVEEVAHWFEIEPEEAVELFKELHNRHAIFLDLDELTVRMANPFSGIPTDFKVHANGKTYFANCAWDMLGIPAALHTDAVIEAKFTESNESVQLEIKNGQIANGVILSRNSGEGSLSPTSETLRPLASLGAQSDTLLVHFPLPFARWYDDLVFT